jgi:hypothetical protein
MRLGIIVQEEIPVMALQQVKAQRGEDGVVRTEWKNIGPQSPIRLPSSRILLGLKLVEDGTLKKSDLDD